MCWVKTQFHRKVLTIDDVKSHWYGKAQRAGRKMGHINVSAKDNSALGNKLLQLADMLPEQDYPGVRLMAERLLQS